MPGGSRRLWISAFDGVRGSISTAGVFAGTYVSSNTPGAKSHGQIVYDSSFLLGPFESNINPTGLGGVDFKVGGTANSVSIDVTFFDL